MLAALGSLGCDKDLLSALTAFAGVDVPKRGFDSKADAMRFLRGPLVVHGTAWMDNIPDWMPAQAMAERSEIVLGDSPYIVGPTELAAVMYPATMEHPLRWDATELYLWAGANASARHFGRKVGDYWKNLNMRPIEDKEVIEPGGRLWHDYSMLAREIRTKVISAQAARDRAANRNGEADIQCTSNVLTTPEIVGGLQLDLFAGG